MSVMTHRYVSRLRDGADRPATASDLAFARQKANRHFWRRTKTLVRHAWGPLIIYSILSIALVAAIAIRMGVWVPQVWR